MLNERAEFLWMIINFDTLPMFGGRSVRQKVTADDNLDVLRSSDIFFVCP